MKSFHQVPHVSVLGSHRQWYLGGVLQEEAAPTPELLRVLTDTHEISVTGWGAAQPKVKGSCWVECWCSDARVVGGSEDAGLKGRDLV